MTTLLKRLSLSLERREDAPRLASTTSFNDFSMHIGQDIADEPRDAGHLTSGAAAAAPPPSPDFRNPFTVGSAPAGGGFCGLAKSPALRIPRSSVAHLMEQRLRGNGGESGTPRSSLDLPPASAPTPRAPALLSSPRTPTALSSSLAAAEEPASPRSPRSPRSPTTPGGRRRKQGKIDGMDYYEFCELIRASSL